MAFLALASQKTLLTLQLNFLQFRQISISNQRQVCADQMGAAQQTSALDDATQDPEYIKWQQMDNMLDTEQASIESQMTALQNEISSLKTLVNNNIKTTCTLNLASGS